MGRKEIGALGLAALLAGGSAEAKPPNPKDAHQEVVKSPKKKAGLEDFLARADEENPLRDFLARADEEKPKKSSVDLDDETKKLLREGTEAATGYGSDTEINRGALAVAVQRMRVDLTFLLSQLDSTDPVAKKYAERALKVLRATFDTRPRGK